MSTPGARETVTRAVHDAELLEKGAVFENGMLSVAYLSGEQIDDLAGRGNQPVYIPDTVSQAEDPVAASHELVRDAHLRQRIGVLAANLNPYNASEYLATLRTHTLEAAGNTASKDYDLSQPYLTVPLVSSERMSEKVRQQEPRLVGASENGPLLLDPTEQIVHRATMHGLQRQAIEIDSISKRIGMEAGELGVAWPHDSLSEMSDDQRNAIITSMYAERSEVMTIAEQHGVPIANSKRFRLSRALIYRSADELQAAIASRPDIEPERIIKAFLQRAIAFTDTVTAMQPQAETPTAAAAPKLTPKEQKLRARINELLAKDTPLIWSPDMQPGETIYPETTDQLDDIVLLTAARLEQSAADKYGAAQRSVFGSPSFNQRVVDYARPAKFNGKLLNPRAVLLPTNTDITDQFLAKFPAKDHPGNIDPKSITRINAIMDMQTTGHGIMGHSIVDMILFTRNAQDPAKRQHGVKFLYTAHGDRVAAYLRNRSVATAYNMLRRAVRRPFSGGFTKS